MRVRYTRRSFSGLDDIRNYARLGDFPEAGLRSDELDVRVLFATRYPYSIYYRIVENEVIILHIRHAARKPLAKGDV